MPRSLRVALVALLAAAVAARAERLPWHVYTTAHGMAGDSVRDLLLDSRGYLWIGTGSGLSRFDGRSFRNYGTADGLPGPRIESLAETRDGSIWALTFQGVARLRPDTAAGTGPFEAEPGLGEWDRRAGQVLHAGRDGTLWAGFGEQLVRIALDDRGGVAAAVAVEMPAPTNGIASFAEAADGTLWIGTGAGLVRRGSGGAFEAVRIGDRVEGVPTPAGELVRSLAVDRQGRVWAGANGVLLVWAPPRERPASAAPVLAGARWARYPGDLPATPGEAVVYGADQGLPSIFDNATRVGRDTVWVATRQGLFAVRPDGTRTIALAHGLPEAHVSAVVEDDEGALWLGTESRGLARLGRSGFVTFDEADGLASGRATTLFESPPSELWAVTFSRELHRFDGRRFENLTPRALFPRHLPGWGWSQYVLRDRRGRTWYPTADGLFRFPAVERPAELRDALPERRWTRGHGLGGNDVFRVWEDGSGDVWVSTLAADALTVFVGGERPLQVPEAGAGPLRGAATAFAEDGSGALWIGFYIGGLARRSGGVWHHFDVADGVPPGFVYDLHTDRAGRLWIATGAGGVARVDDPAAASPAFRTYTTRDGLASDATRCLAEDAAGRILVGTPRGVDRIDPVHGGVRSFSVRDGLPNSMVVACHAATDGALWFGTFHGLARFVPPADEPPRPPRVRLAALEIAGVPQSIPELGTESVARRVLAPSQRSMRVEFVAVALGLGENLRYQHRVLGAGGDWSAPSAERSVHLAALSPGGYRFEVRATTLEGRADGGVAGFDFELLRPFWQRPWFVIAIAGALAGLAAAAVRLRTARLVAVERARTRIAADLHDDVGSSVSRIGLLGELARRRLRDEPAAAESILADIGQEASELAEATSDIVWSIDPRRDDLDSLVVRLRRFAADLLEAREIELEFAAPTAAASVPLDPEVRRALYLTLKEAIHNVAKHSSARRAVVRIEVGASEVRAEVADDGCGIDPERAAQAFAEGRHGLGGMAARAAAVGGEARIEPAPGGGTRLVLRFPTGRTGSHRRAISTRRRD